jgi:hypothetical protein
VRASAVGTAGVAPRDDQQIRAALKRYEQAYNRYGAKIAGSARITEGGFSQPKLDLLPSKRMSLGACDISISGEVGVAMCAGKPALDPKISRTAAQRYWAFNLRRHAHGWHIEQLSVE